MIVLIHKKYSFVCLENIFYILQAAQDLEKDAKQLFLASYIEELSSKNNSSNCYVDGIIYSLLANGMLVFIPKYGIKGAVHLSNKDKKVAVVQDDVQWLDGCLDIVDSSLIVKASGIEQKYSIFDHVTVSIFYINLCRSISNILFFICFYPYFTFFFQVLLLCV